MLRFLSVRHLAVIDRLEVEFEPGLTVLTGETGAGKSVIIEAIDLLVGGRASSDLVRTGEELATVQAVVEMPGGQERIVRREVSSQGRSRAFLDDALATTTALREWGSHAIDLHGQHEHQALLDPAEHIGLLDVFLQEPELVVEVGGAFEAWRQAQQALARTRIDEREKRARIEIATFQLQEIEKVAPVAGEDERSIEERTVLANADRLSRLATEAFSALYDGDAAALTSLAAVWKRVDDLARLDSRFAPYVEGRDAIKSQLDDLALMLRSYAADLDAAPDRLEVVEARLAALERLKKKFGPGLSDVLERQEGLRAELSALGASAEHAEVLERAESARRAAFVECAGRLSGRRKTAGAKLARALAEALGDLAMPKCRVDVRVMPQDAPESWTRAGTDAVEFFLSPNPGEELRPLARIASGGELSRVMLALRTLAAPDEPGRTLIFDEVDAGIGGAAADAVGARLQTLADRYQVLCITHLPQIAARADTHLRISKHVRAGRTSTEMTRLDQDGREQELARMIAGAEVTAPVLASAREMLTSRRKSEVKTKRESESATMAKAKGRQSGR